MVFKFMGATYRIRFERADLGENWGLCKYGTRELHIAKGLLPRQVAATLIHEMTHATFDQLGCSFGWTGRYSEMMVNRVVGIVEAIIKDNPALVLEIVGGLVGSQHKKSKRRARK